MTSDRPETDRRSFVKRAAVVGGITAWAAPAINAVTNAAAAVSAAETAGAWTLTISGNTNIPTFRLTNDSTTIDITRVTLTIGDTSRNWDSAYQENAGPGISFVRIQPDANHSGGIRSDVVEYTFTGFGPAKSFSWASDVDPDNTNTTQDYRRVLFNNGAAPNAVATVWFSDGSSLAKTWPDGSTSASTYTLSAP